MNGNVYLLKVICPFSFIITNIFMLFEIRINMMTLQFVLVVIQFKLEPVLKLYNISIIDLLSLSEVLILFSIVLCYFQGNFKEL